MKVPHMIEDIHDKVYNEIAGEVIEMANRMADRHIEDVAWDIADGLLAGAVQYWLFSRHPCDDPRCPDCEFLNTAEKRLRELLGIVEEMAKDSEYYHCLNDANVGRA